MGRIFLVGYDEIPSRGCMCCALCRTRVAFVKDHIANFTSGDKHFVKVQERHKPLYNVYIYAGLMLKYRTYEISSSCKWKYSSRHLLYQMWNTARGETFPQPATYAIEGSFYIMRDKLIRWNDDQGGGGHNEQGPNNQHGVPNEQDGGVNEQEVGIDEQVPDDQGVANEQNDDQDGGANEQAANEDVDLAEVIDNIDQDGGVHEQDVPDDQGVANEQNDDQDGGANEQAPNEDVDMAEAMDNIDQDGGR
ncbi:hypothetical protein HAX54_036176 [Datura stramonium]|uniref:Yippee domain-containing protein n=1 Tax=Datura stramonium TaxID=4076 RepID=A0ABS8SFW6_DATST|nr:hypothetical protein [Datura stramonium]